MAGVWSKMSNEPREREPIERVRARLETLVRANAAPRCGARCKQADGQALPSGSHAERSVQRSRRQEYGAADAGGPRAQQASKLETRSLFAGSQGGTVARAGGGACAPLSVHHGTAALTLWRHVSLATKVAPDAAPSKGRFHTLRPETLRG